MRVLAHPIEDVVEATVVLLQQLGDGGCSTGSARDHGDASVLSVPLEQYDRPSERAVVDQMPQDRPRGDLHLEHVRLPHLGSGDGRASLRECSAPSHSRWARQHHRFTMTAAYREGA